MSASDSLIELLYRALNSERGIVISTTDPVRTKALFYKERQTDPALLCLSLLTHPLNPQTEMVILRKPESEDEGG